MSAAKKVFWTQHFSSYADASLSGDPERVAAFYAPSFIAAGPRGGEAYHNDDAFRDWLRGVHAGNQAAGMTHLEVLGLDESAISDSHTLINVEWGARFRATGTRVIAFRIAYLLQLHEPAPTILAFVSHEDQEEAMKREGIL
jgi:hypothetical protein